MDTPCCFARCGHAVLLRPVGRLLSTQFLHFAGQVREPDACEELVPDVQLDDDERELAAKLLDTKTTIPEATM